MAQDGSAPYLPSSSLYSISNCMIVWIDKAPMTQMCPMQGSRFGRCLESVLHASIMLWLDVQSMKDGEKVDRVNTAEVMHTRFGRSRSRDMQSLLKF